jgi:ATP synthase delta (OSCP) subunit
MTVFGRATQVPLAPVEALCSSRGARAGAAAALRNLLVYVHVTPVGNQESLQPPWQSRTARALMQIVTLRSAARLDQEQEFKIAKKLQEMTSSKNIKIKPVIDAALMGGFIIEFGDNKVDLSIRGHLERIRTELLEGEKITG